MPEIIKIGPPIRVQSKSMTLLIPNIIGCLQKDLRSPADAINRLGSDGFGLKKEPRPD
jgi:hypothetical protein